MDSFDLGRGILYVGLLLVVIGGLVMVGGRLVDLGNLPGDFRYEGENVRVYFPLATMIVVSIVLTILLNLLLRFWR